MAMVEGRPPNSNRCIQDIPVLRPFWTDIAVKRNLLLLCAWLIIVNIFALLALNRLNLRPDTAFEWMDPRIFRPRQGWDIIGLHNRWDSYWFLDVAQKGYYLRGPDDFANVAFFPLYPLTMRLVGTLTGGNLVLAGWMVSSVFLALAVVMLTRLVRQFHPAMDPLWPVAFLLVFPTAFFLNAVYSESMFLFFSLAMFHHALQGRFPLAALFAALASGTRMAGVFLVAPLIVEFVKAKGGRALLSRSAWPLALAPAGAFFYFLYHYFSFGDFFLYLKIQDRWGRDFSTEAVDFSIRNNPDLVNTAFDMADAAAAVVLGLIALRRLRLSYGIYILVSVGIVLTSGTTLGIERYIMVLFPIYLVAAGFQSVVVKSAWLLGSSLMLALNIIRFVNHYWAG
jgi:hypothetical protein